MLREIPNIAGLQFLNCRDCQLLRIIDNEQINNLYDNNCPVLFYTPSTPKIRINKLKDLIKKNYKYFKFKRLIKSRNFVEHYYDPENRVGHMVKIRMLEEIEEMIKL
jgi:hypothetical protein